MKRLNWLIFRSFLGPLFMSFGVILFLLLLQFLAAYVDKFAGKGVGLEILGSIFLFASGKLTLLALPVSVLAAALMSFGNFAENNELSAMKSSGISLLKVARPLVVLSFVITGITLWFSFQVVPLANLKFANLLYDIGKKKAEMSLQPGQFYQDIDGYTIRIADKNAARRSLYDVLIYDRPGQGEIPREVIAADSARMLSSSPDASSLHMILYHGVKHEEHVDESNQNQIPNYGRTYFDSLQYRFRLEGFELEETEEKLFKNHELTSTQKQLHQRIEELLQQQQQQKDNFGRNVSTYNHVSNTLFHREVHPSFLLDSLRQHTSQNPVKAINQALTQSRAIKNLSQTAIRSQDRKQKLLNRYLFEFHTRIANPLHVTFFMIIGIALGAIIRKGGLGLPALISTLLLVLSYILNTQGKKLAAESIADPILLAWFPAIFFGLLALLLLYLASRELKSYPKFLSIFQQ